MFKRRSSQFTLSKDLRTRVMHWIGVQLIKVHFFAVEYIFLWRLFLGHLLTGDNSKNIHLWRPAEAAVSSWTVEQRPFTGHEAAVEDIQWSPSEASVFSSCSTDKTVRIWDIRAPPNKACMITVENAHDMDVNVIR